MTKELKLPPRPEMAWDGNPKDYLAACTEIVRGTRDGDALSRTDLKLVEQIVNADVFGVSEDMEAAFGSLYMRVKLGYAPPWLHGIEGLTIDHEGYVYWKGQNVEHYDTPWAYTKLADGIGRKSGEEAALELARRCRLLEARGSVVSTTSAIWRWEDEIVDSAPTLEA